VFHLRLKHFELQAERLMDKTLQTRAVAIVHSNRQDGKIISVSNEAKEEGLYVGMSRSLARQMNRRVLLLPYNHSLYSRLNRYLYSTVSTFTPIVEPGNLGQFYLDMNGMDSVYKNLQNTGMTLARTVHDKTQLSGAVGISTNKLVSHISTSVIPEIVNEVFPGDEPSFLSPLDSLRLPTVQQTSVSKIVRFLFLDKVAHLQAIVKNETDTHVLFGKYAKRLTLEAEGKDLSAVRPPQMKEHVTEQIVLPADTNDQNELYTAVNTLSGQIGFHLRKRNQTAKKLELEIHYTDGIRCSRFGVLHRIDHASVTAVIQRLFDRANIRRNRIRTILADASGFVQHTSQLDLFDPEDRKEIRLSHAVDAIRRKYGVKSIY